MNIHMNGIPILAAVVFGVACLCAFSEAPRCEEAKVIKLPAPRTDSGVSVEKALAGRRSIRTFAKEPLTLAEVSQFLWAAQGITGNRGGTELRTAPSAGALYGLETYLAVANVTGLDPGVYHYSPQGHTLVFHKPGDVRETLSKAAMGQACIKEGAALIIFTGVYERITKKYVERGVKFAHMEAGHASENVYLQAEALGLGTVAAGSFDEKEAKRILNLPENEEPLYIMPVGRKAE
jgi:SagB-type dehydrogenase family enzyme